MNSARWPEKRGEEKKGHDKNGDENLKLERTKDDGRHKEMLIKH
jgi:hypothetical protein